MSGNYKLTISYDGTAYCGWQVQPNGISIQALIEAALSTILRKQTAIHGSGRTDAGVHACGQTAHFKTEIQFDNRRLLHSLNGILPSSIRILSIENVPEDFHARFSATGKEYHYHLWLDPVQSPFQRLYSLHVRKHIDFKALQKACALFVGTHNFASFANEAHRGSAARDPVRTLTRLDAIETAGGVRLEFEADGFLYKMVRNITGTLLEAATGSLSDSAIRDIFSAKDRRAAPAAVPPQGLFLHKVFY